MMMMMGTMIIIIIIINSNTFINFSLVGRPVSSARAPGNDYRFIDRRAIIFVAVVDLGAIAIRLQWASCHRDRGNAVIVTIALFKTLMSESFYFALGSVHSYKGSGVFGTRSSSQLTAWVASCESCRKKLYCDTDRASLGRDPRDR